MNIYSKLDPTKLLHIIVRRQDITAPRTNIIPDNQFLQCATMKLPKGTTFKAHKHIWKMPVDGPVIAQESWCIIRGSVKVFLYDTDDTLLHEDIIQTGELSVTLEGPHNYLILEDDSVIAEYKTGPYLGVEFDKVFI